MFIYVFKCLVKPGERTRECLGIVRRRGLQGLHDFIRALNATAQKGIADILTEGLTNGDQVQSLDSTDSPGDNPLNLQHKSEYCTMMPIK